jgi:ubiquinone biosynthesis protein UbiJ
LPAQLGDVGVFREGAVSVSGNPVLAQDFQRLLRLAWPDWEEELARLVGDVAAHQLGSAARTLFRWGRDAGATLRRDIAEFLTEESRDLPSRHEVEEFLDAVDALRSDAERAEVRLSRLEGRNRDGQEG